MCVRPGFVCLSDTRFFPASEKKAEERKRLLENFVVCLWHLADDGRLGEEGDGRVDNGDRRLY